MDPKFIRNFCIIAHIDHGKSTLADRLLEMTGALTEREMHEQVLDSMDLERERGITIKAKSIRLHYKAKDGNTYRLNLIDTPGHVDFSYEVSRALSACEGALLVVDASQGVEAQTVANTFLAASHNLTILPLINKIDLPAAQPDFVKEQIESVLAIPAEDALLISAKSGIGVEDVLEAIVARVPRPKGSAENPLQALIFDSWFDIYRGAVVLVRVMEGRIKNHVKIKLVAGDDTYEVEQLGTLTPKPIALEELEAGDVGFIVANIKRVADARMGDTVIEVARPAPALPGFEAIKPMVFAGLFPVLADDYEPLRDALGKLQLNDAAFFYEPENSVALGFGFRCGFLGLLHMEIVQERLEREFGINLITTAPSVRYRITTTAGVVVEVDSPTKFPPPNEMAKIEEPVITAMIITAEDSVGAILQLCEEKRGVQKNFEYLSPQRVMLTYAPPKTDSAPDVRGPDPSRHWQPRHRARDRRGDTQERDRQVLRRRYFPQTKTPGEAERRKKTHEARGPRGHSAGSLPRRAEGRQHVRRVTRNSLWFPSVPFVASVLNLEKLSPQRTQSAQRNPSRLMASECRGGGPPRRCARARVAH